jgi:hypothetical protein
MMSNGVDHIASNGGVRDPAVDDEGGADGPEISSWLIN